MAAGQVVVEGGLVAVEEEKAEEAVVEVVAVEEAAEEGEAEEEEVVAVEGAKAGEDQGEAVGVVEGSSLFPQATTYALLHYNHFPIDANTGHRTAESILHSRTETFPKNPRFCQSSERWNSDSISRTRRSHRISSRTSLKRS